MAPVSPSGSTMKVPDTLVSAGQYSVGRPPEAEQTVMRTWWLQTSVGTVPFAKYSVSTAFPLGSDWQTPGLASMPDFRQTWAVSTDDGTGKPVSASPS